jgi:hypothetical protein
MDVFHAAAATFSRPRGLCLDQWTISTGGAEFELLIVVMFLAAEAFDAEVDGFGNNDG